MRWLFAFAVLAISTTAYAGDHFTLYGVGSAIANNDAGLATRIEKRFDAINADDDEETAIFGARMGLEHWRAGGTWGFAAPIGMYFGGQVKKVRSSIGGGVGLWTFAGDGENFGVSPFASHTLEVVSGKLVVAVDTRVSRQTVFNVDDYNVYSVMVMFGPAYR